MEVDSVRDCSTSSTSVLGDLPTSRRTRRYCGHCCEYVGYSTFYRHRSRYYDEHTKQWSRSANHQQTTGTFGLESDSDTDTELQDTFDHSTVNNDREEDEGEHYLECISLHVAAQGNSCTMHVQSI